VSAVKHSSSTATSKYPVVVEVDVVVVDVVVDVVEVVVVSWVVVVVSWVVVVVEVVDVDVVEVVLVVVGGAVVSSGGRESGLQLLAANIFTTGNMVVTSTSSKNWQNSSVK